MDKESRTSQETHTERDIDTYREKEINIVTYIHTDRRTVLLFKTQTQLQNPRV